MMPLSTAQLDLVLQKLHKMLVALPLNSPALSYTWLLQQVLLSCNMMHAALQAAALQPRAQFGLWEEVADAVGGRQWCSPAAVESALASAAATFTAQHGVPAPTAVL